MSDDPVRLAMLGRLVRRRWPLLAALTLLGAVAGVGASVLLSPGYRTSTSVLLQGPREPDVLVTEAQVAQSTVVLDRAAIALGWTVTGPELKGAVSAEVAEGNVIRITGTAGSPERAQQLADQVAQEYVRFSTQLVSDTADASAQVAREQRETLRQQIAQTNERITELHAAFAQELTVDSVQARTQLEALRSTLAQAMNKLDAADAASAQAKMVVMGQAERPAGPASPTMAQLVAGAALLFFAGGVLGLFIAARGDRRLRDDAQLAAAVGAPVLAGVDVAHGGPGAEARRRPGSHGPRSWPGLVWRLLWDGQPWDLPRPQASSDAASRRIRFRRLLDRLGQGGHQRVLLVVSDGDEPALAAAEQLAALSGEDTGGGHRVRTVATVARVMAGSPTVPGGDGGVVVVLSPGTRTGLELVGIAEACEDAGRDVLGAVVVHRTGPAGRARLRPGAAPDTDAADAAGSPGAPDSPQDRPVLAGAP